MQVGKSKDCIVHHADVESELLLFSRTTSPEFATNVETVAIFGKPCSLGPLVLSSKSDGIYTVIP